MRRNGGFTLVEILIVCAILLVLAGILLPMLFKVQQDQIVRNAEAEIEFLKSALEQYRKDFGDYPPSFLAELGDSTDPGEVPNQGNRTLTACLATRKANGPYLASYMLNNKEKLRTTSDTADHDLTGWVFDSDNHRELLDPWGRPYIYLHNRDYEPQQENVYTMGGLTDDGTCQTPCTVKGQHDDDGNYYNPYTFQVWSCGPNGINDNGGEDDIVSWQTE